MEKTYHNKPLRQWFHQACVEACIATQHLLAVLQFLHSMDPSFPRGYNDDQVLAALRQKTDAALQSFRILQTIGYENLFSF